MKITELYNLLCRLYGVFPNLDITHFVMMLSPNAEENPIRSRLLGREALLIHEAGGCLELGLFLDPSILTALEPCDVLNHLDEFACACEGVSHFLYVVDRAQKEMKISRLELELQGEVDKFLLIHLIAARQNGAVAPSFFERLFEQHRFDRHLSPEDRNRYEQASYFAAKYCFFLRQRFFNPLRLGELMPQARDFFSRDFTSKLALLIP
jgi:hypothetical protein